MRQLMRDIRDVQDVMEVPHDKRINPNGKVFKKEDLEWLLLPTEQTLKKLLAYTSPMDNQWKGSDWSMRTLPIATTSTTKRRQRLHPKAQVWLKCEFCDEQFVDNTSRSAHERTKHPKEAYKRDRWMRREYANKHCTDRCPACNRWFHGGIKGVCEHFANLRCAASKTFLLPASFVRRMQHGGDGLEAYGFRARE